MREGRKLLIVGCDPMSQTLAILERERAIEDSRFIRTLVDSRTVGDLRTGDPAALLKARHWYDDCRDKEEDPPFDDLPDDHSYRIVDWFGDDSWYNMLPLARLITEETAPTEIIHEFGQDDFGVGLDYERATWFRLEDEGDIVTRLRALGHQVDDSNEAQEVISKYDYLSA